MHDSKSRNQGSLEQKILRQLDAIFEQRGRGTQAWLMRQMGVARNYITRMRAGEVKLTLSRLEEILAVLEVEPFEFFARAFRPDAIQELEIDVLLLSSSEPETFMGSKEVREAVEMMRQKGLWNED